MKVGLIAKPGGPSTGVGRYVRMLQAGLSDRGLDVARGAPAVPPVLHLGSGWLGRRGVDIPTFLTNYPIWADYPRAEIYHLTSQNLATLLLFRRPPGPTVVTIHDIIPYLLRDDPALCSYRTIADRVFDRLAMAGLRRADRLIADSQSTKQSVIQHLGIQPAKIRVVYLGIDHEHFRPRPVSAEFRARYRLPEGRRYLIYVGSEDPRKNLVTLIRALAEVRSKMPQVELIKVGRAHFAGERRRLIDLATQLAIREAIHFVDEVSDDDLPLLYRLADVCVMPSLYEGFGFPILEAMACTTGVVCAETGPFPELLGERGRRCRPRSVADFARAILDQLGQGRSDVEGQANRETALQFTWEKTISATLQTYLHVFGGATEPALLSPGAKRTGRGDPV